MSESLIKKAFLYIFILLLFVPLIGTDFRGGTISEAEKRRLAYFPEFVKDRRINENFFDDFEKWFNDNVGFRSMHVVNNAIIQYHLFDVLSNNTNMFLGPNGELNYATEPMIKDYQHLNKYDEEYLLKVSESFQTMNDYLKRKDITLFYYQCWDKHSVYPEQFPTSLLQYGSVSKTDQIIDELSKNTDVIVVSPKDLLIEKKHLFKVYSVWGDPTHWTQRGAYIGYCLLMDNINKSFNNQFKVLKEMDYNITTMDQGQTLFGGIHNIEELEDFKIKNPTSTLTNEKLSLYSDDNRHKFFTNTEVDNKTRILIIGDSYFNSFIIDDISESFFETILLWGDYLHDFKKIIESYKPDIVVIEAAERVDRTRRIIEAADTLK